MPSPGFLMMAPCQVTFSLETVTCTGRETISGASANSIHILANIDYCNTHTMGSQDIHTYRQTYICTYIHMQKVPHLRICTTSTFNQGIDSTVKLKTLVQNADHPTNVYTHCAPLPACRRFSLALSALSLQLSSSSSASWIA